MTLKIDDARLKEEEDFYLSDIHVEQQDELTSCLLRIEISFPIDHYEKPKNKSSEQLIIDSDGDFDRGDDIQITDAVVIRIQHAMDTPLSRVGLQMWRASFFLSDYILNNLGLVRDQVVVDLGTGLGLTSFVTAAYARLVFCTDLAFVVKQAHSNWIANRDALDAKNKSNIRFKRLNWYEHETFLTAPNKNSGKLFMFCCFFCC